MKNLKLNLSLPLILICCIHVFGQEDEATFEKGVLIEQKVQEISDNYGFISTLYDKGVEKWNNTHWNFKPEPSILFSTGAYTNNTIYRLESEPINLPSLNKFSERISLILEEKFELESYFDKGIVYVSDDGGGTWQVVSIRSGASKLRKVRINLSAFAGKKVLLAFELKTDESNTYAGWDLKSIVINKEYLKTSAVTSTASSAFAVTSSTATNNTSGLQSALLSLDAQKFPRFAYANLTVNYNGNTLGTLDSSNFNIVETIDTTNFDTIITVKKDATFRVYSPELDTTRRPVDIIFLMDNSGSMSGEQAAVAANVESFVNDLDTSGFDYRLALCRFGQSESSGVPILYNNAAWYSKATDFIKVWGVNTIDGYREPSWDALIESARGYDFAEAAQKVFILITDEAMTGNNINYSVCKDRQEVIDILQASGVTLFTLVPGFSAFEYDFADVADSTGGMSFLITDPFNEILDSIGKQISSTYTVRYTPTWPYFDGFERDVDIMIDYNLDTITLKGSYIPGAAPIIIRTNSTIALDNKKVIKNDTVLIEAYVYDYYPPYTRSVTLYYRNVSDTTAYNAISMSYILSSNGDSVWSAQIPILDVLDPGIKYYIKATDGQSTTTAPEFIDLEGYPWSFAVIPNYAPEIYDLTEKDSIYVGDTVCFRAHAKDVTDSIEVVYIYLRAMYDIGFSVYEMKKDTGNTYIYDEYTLSEGITEFFFVAEDNYGVSTFFGDEISPLTIAPETKWEIITTPYKHTIYLSGIDMSSFPFKIWTTDVLYDGNPLVYGDMIGVFYTDTVCDSQGNCEYEHKCAGTYDWQGPLTIGAKILVYGDNPQTTGKKEGFKVGEKFIFKIYKEADSSSHMAEYNFRAPLKDTVFASGGSSEIDSIWTVNKQSTILKKGLNLWSTCMVPKECSFNSIFANQPYVNQVMDDKDNTWLPGQSSTLTDYVPGYGYEVYMDSSSILDVFGSLLDLSVLSLKLVGNQESTLIGCPYSSPENVESVFSNHTNNVYAVDKYINDGTGEITIETHSPMFAINNWTDKNMNPGEAYYVFAVYPQNAFTFPSASGPYKSVKNTIRQTGIPQRVHSQKKYMHVFLPNNVWDKIPEQESKIRAYNADNELIGVNQADETGTLLILDGHFVDEGETFSLQLWSPGSNQEQVIKVAWETGENKYRNLKSAVASRISTQTNTPIAVYPNPTEGTFKVSFSLEQEQNVKFYLRDASGKTVLVISDEKYQPGNHMVDIDISSQSAGIYNLTVQTDQTVVATKVIKMD